MGVTVGFEDGLTLGVSVGVAVGEIDGLKVGVAVGEIEGLLVGVLNHSIKKNHNFVCSFKIAKTKEKTQINKPTLLELKLVLQWVC